MPLLHANLFLCFPACIILSAFSWNTFLSLFCFIAWKAQHMTRLVGLFRCEKFCSLFSASPFDVQETQPEAEAASSPRQRMRKTTQDAHGSFFLRVGAIGKYLMMHSPVRRFYDSLIFSSTSSFRFGLVDLHWIGVWNFLRDSPEVAMPWDFAWR